MAGLPDKQELISELLKPIRLTGVFQSWWAARAPWSVEGGGDANYVTMHYVVSGSCWVSAPGQDPVLLEQEDLALFITGAEHRIGDSPDRPGQSISSLLGDPAEGPNTIEIGGSGVETRFLCAGLHCDSGVASNLREWLPWIMVLKAEELATASPLAEVLKVLADDRPCPEPGARLITLRAFEMAFIAALQHVLSKADDTTLLVPAMGHKQIAQALGMLHRRYAEQWSVDTLAREVGMSRSAFTSAFTRLVGDSPARHLTGIRMREAARLLVETGLPLSVVHQRVGYNSSVGFHLAFRNWFGMPPGEYRVRASVRGERRDTG